MDDLLTYTGYFFLAFVIFLFVGFGISMIKENKFNLHKNIEIQQITETDNGYYITINNKIYYSEVLND